MIGGLLLLFGVLSRFFERQADVYAARTIESINQSDAPPATSYLSGSHVGEYGATVFGSALYRVAVINNIPIASRTLTHGSISDRIEYLRAMSTDPERTRRFDRFMSWVYLAPDRRPGDIRRVVGGGADAVNRWQPRDIAENNKK